MLWRQLARGVRALIHRARVDEELDEEIRDYFDRARADLEREGLSPQDAARAARRKLGRWPVIVGIVGDVKQTSLALGAPDAFYVAAGQWPWVDTVQSLVVRTEGDAAALVPAVKRAIWSVDPTLPIVRVETMEKLVAGSEAQRRFTLVVFGAFAAAALVLAALGLYGVIAAGVAARTREFGLRAALGASPAGITGMVLRHGLALGACGVAIGVVGTAAATRALSSLLFGVSPLDPATYGRVIAVVLAAAIAACWLPAWRAARVDPSITLRAE